MTPTVTPRASALEILIGVVVRGHKLSSAMEGATRALGDPRDAALVQELCFGVLRWLPRLEALLALLLKRPLKARDRDLQIMLLLGLYQLLYTRIPPHAAVAETVSLTWVRGKPWARGLINGVLRRFQRERTALLQAIESSDSASLAHPSWMIAALRRCWPQQWHAILTANNERPPMSLRVNRRVTDRQAYQGQLARAGILAQATPHTDDGLILDAPLDIRRLPGFAEGMVSVQDSAAQLAAPLLDLWPGQRVLDACAAPGGKSAHILEQAPHLAELVALDKAPDRVARLEQTLGRLALEATVVCADATAPAQWWDGRPFDRVLLDAPCSGTGVIRRHPDIKLLRREAQLPSLLNHQARLLDALWPLLAPGGTLLYATCSVLCQENEAQIERFASTHHDVTVLTIDAPWGQTRHSGRQVLPGEDGMDGFFYALLRRG